MNWKPFLPLVVAAAALAGCTQNTDTEAATTDTTATAAAKAGHEGHQHEEGAACSECAQATSQILHPEVTTTQGPDGETIVHAGMELAGAEEVTVADLMANPDAWAGKTVKIAGNVSAMCKHKRAWFAVVGDDQSGNHVRVFTAPNFLVPHDSIGKTAVAEGTVEIVEIPVDRAKHMAAEHKLGEPEDIQAPLKQVLIRATGADFS